MLTDIFANRYATVTLWETFEERDRRFLVQAFRIVSEQLYKPYRSNGSENASATTAWRIIQAKISTELGLEELAPHLSGYYRTWSGNQLWQTVTHSDHDVCKKFTLEEYRPSISSDRFMKERVSLIEIAFRERHADILKANAVLPADCLMANLRDQPSSGSIRVPGNRADGLKAVNDELNLAFNNAVGELNARFQQAGYGLHFHNGFIQESKDALIREQIEAPFWALVSGADWTNVDTDMKEAIDCRDNGGRDPAWHAMRALESTMKIISRQKGWTHGGEKGPHNYIDNLRSRKNGEFINEWESRLLKEFFTAVRNPLGHGPGDAEMPSLSVSQTEWAIEFCMIWVKNLVRRM